MNSMRIRKGDKVAVMENGRVVEQGSVYEVFSNPQTSVAAKFVATSLRNEPDVVETETAASGEVSSSWLMRSRPSPNPS